MIYKSRVYVTSMCKIYILDYLLLFFWLEQQTDPILTSHGFIAHNY